MQLYVKDGVVLAWHDDGQSVPASAYGPGVSTLPFAGSLESLGRVGDPLPDGVPDTRPYVAPPIDLVPYTAALRFARETGGITVEGMPIATDRQSQAMIANAFALVQLQPGREIRFKTNSGFVTLDAAAVQIIAVAVAEHVQAAFATEGDVLAAIGAGTITTAAEIDAAFAPPAD